MSNRVFVSRDGEGMKRSRRLHLCVESGICWSRIKGLSGVLERKPSVLGSGRGGCGALCEGLGGAEGGGGLAVQKRDKSKDSCPSATF